jgi:hypothetical protein
MPANADPIYTREADIQWSQGYMTAANTTADLTSGTSYLLFTADATNGGFVRSVRLKPTPGGNTTATVVRFWVNNGSTTGTAVNNSLVGELTLPSVTASGTLGSPDYEYALNIALPPGYRLYATIHTASANGWAATVFGGKY